MARSWMDGLLQDVSNQLLLNAEAQTGNAALSAKKARVEAERAKTEADIVTKRAEDLSQYVGVVARSVNPRQIDRERFKALMKGQPKRTVEIWYDPTDSTDDEAKLFAIDLLGALGKDGIGWDASIKQFPPNPSRDKSIDMLRVATMSSNGLAYGAKTVSIDRDSPLQVLWNAVELSLGGWGIGGATLAPIPSLPDNVFVISVGRHRVNVPLVKFAPPKTKQIKKQSR